MCMFVSPQAGLPLLAVHAYVCANVFVCICECVYMHMSMSMRIGGPTTRAHRSPVQRQPVHRVAGRAHR